MATEPPNTQDAGNGLTRVERDGRGLRTTFEELEVGASLGEMHWSVHPENARGLMESDQDYHPWYVGESPWGRPIVPLMATYPPVRILFTRRYNVRGLFYQFDSEFYEPLHYGDAITISGRVSDKWVRRDREYVTYQAEGRSEDGVLLFSTQRTHVLDYMRRTTPREGEGIDSGTALQ